MIVHNFVMEYREVKSKTKSNRVAGVQRFRSALSELIVLESTILDGIKFISLGTFSNVSIVVTHHLVEESFGLISSSDSNALILDNLNNLEALIIKLALDFLFVLSKSIIELLILWILFDGTDSSNSSSLRSNLVLKSNRKEVSLFSSEVFIFVFDNLLKILDHIIESLGLLGNSGHENKLF